MTLRRFIMRLRPYIISMSVFFALLPISRSYTIPMATDGYNSTQQALKPEKSLHNKTEAVSISKSKARSKKNNQSKSNDNNGLWYSGYTNFKPPKVVLNFLNNPTKQNAVKYLKWQRESTEKLLVAMRVLRQVEKEMYTAKPKHLSDDILVVFFSPECPHCRDQLNILKNVVKDYPSIDIVLYPIDNPPMAEKLLKKMGLSKYLVYNDPVVERLNTATAVPYLVFISRSRERVMFSHTGVMNYEGIMEHL